MLPPFNIRRGRNLGSELEKAREVAEFALQTGSLTSKDVKDIGLPSAIANQVLRKYGRNSILKSVKSAILTVPAQSTRTMPEAGVLRIACLKLDLDISYLPTFEKVNQVELDDEFTRVTVTINEPPVREVDNWIGVDLNSTGHVAVTANQTTGEVQRYGEEVPPIHKKYSNLRRCLYKEGHPKVAKGKILRKSFSTDY